MKHLKKFESFNNKNTEVVKEGVIGDLRRGVGVKTNKERLDDKFGFTSYESNEIVPSGSLKSYVDQGSGRKYFGSQLP